MPIYEYECTSCHHHFDLMQKISDEPAKQCPQCFQNSAVRLISAAGFQLKGSGWYATDFKNKGKSEPKKETTSANAEKTTGSEKKSEDKKTTGSTSTSKKGDSE
ncbi:Zinc ribbon domain protein [Legionella nautarum]|uniref:Zinc ribbon domain protein n=1 Tax=Legionella nautarum TaxID=45070 RepID=A0A0W0WVG7_9GAMM|nr:zinc ribbon domain-containing protein [Legionella nautarum]KTD36298.1 Zinc ribbon domain protein [Legionella nautarum]